MLIKLHNAGGNGQCDPKNEVWINPNRVFFIEQVGTQTLIKFPGYNLFVLEPKEVVVNLINTNEETENHNKKMESQDDE